MQLVNHGIPSDVISSMIDVSTRFFELPFEERAKYMSSDMHAPVRYGTSFNQKKDKVFCWRDFLKLMCHPLPDVLPHWPSSPVDMRWELAQPKAWFFGVKWDMVEVTWPIIILSFCFILITFILPKLVYVLYLQTTLLITSLKQWIQFAYMSLTCIKYESTRNWSINAIQIVVLVDYLTLLSSYVGKCALKVFVKIYYNLLELGAVLARERPHLIASSLYPSWAISLILN